MATFGHMTMPREVEYLQPVLVILAAGVIFFTCHGGTLVELFATHNNLAQSGS